MNTEESCVATIKKGAYVALGFIVVFLAVFLMGKIDSSSALLGGFIFGILGIFVYRKSRIAATLLMILATTNAVSFFIKLGTITNIFNNHNGVIFSMIILYLPQCFKAMMATYHWHKYYNFKQ